MVNKRIRSIYNGMKDVIILKSIIIIYMVVEELKYVKNGKTILTYFMSGA